jgi:large subunit ribosomal protein L23
MNNKTNIKKQRSKKSSKSRHSAEVHQANSVIIKPYITEKTFNMIEKENKLTFLVNSTANKKQITEAIKVLYEANPSIVNTARTGKGKKAMIEFSQPEGARDLATRLGLV